MVRNDLDKLRQLKVLGDLVKEGEIVKVGRDKVDRLLTYLNILNIEKITISQDTEDYRLYSIQYVKPEDMEAEEGEDDRLEN